MPFSFCGCLANEAYNTNRTSTSALSITRKPLIEFATNASSRCSRTSDWMRKTNGSSTISITSKRVPSSFQTAWQSGPKSIVMSPDFFNLYSEHILRRLEESNDGVTINGVCINNIRYADDTALIADSEEGLQRLLDLVLDASSDEGLESNCKKTFCMVVSKERQPPTCNLICNGTGIEQVNSFNYLGSMLTSDGRCEKEIRRRIGMAKTSFNQMSPVLKDRKLSIPLKVRLLKCFIWSVLLYGCESWTLSAALTRNIEATEMWFYRRMLRVSYTAHETNISVLQRMGQERQLLRTIKERQTRFTGHIIRKGELEDPILAGKVQGKKARGGQRLLFLNQVMETTGLTSPRTIWDAARNRTK